MSDLNKYESTDISQQKSVCIRMVKNDPKYISSNYKINDKPDEMVKLQLSSDDILAPATFIVPKIIIRYHKLKYNLVKS